MFEPSTFNEIQVNNNFYNNKKNIKNNVYEINPSYKNTINTNFGYSNAGNEYEYDIREIGGKTNKSKKTITIPRREKMEFIPIEFKKRKPLHSVEKFKYSKNMNMRMNNTMNTNKNTRYKDIDDNNIYINEQINLYNQKRKNMPDEYKYNNNVLNKYKKPKMSSSMDKQYINDGYNNIYQKNAKNRKKINYFDGDDDNE